MTFKFVENLDPDLRSALLSRLRVEWTHSSASIEGNSLTLGETNFVIEEGLTIGGKPLREHNEVIGHARAINLAYELLQKESITKEDLFTLHSAVQNEAVIDIFRPVGEYKKEINGRNFTVDGKLKYFEYPHPNAVEFLMGAWFELLNEYQKTALSLKDALRCYTKLHISFVTIHPFFDGNGRLARLLANIPLLKNGFLPLMIDSAKRKEYLELLFAYQISIKMPSINNGAFIIENKQYSALEAFFKEQYKNSLEILAEFEAMQKNRNNKGNM